MKLRAWRYKRFHASYVIGWGALGILIGLGMSKVIPLVLSPLAIAAILLIAISLFRRRRWWAIIGILVCGMVLGISRGSQVGQSLSAYNGFIDSTVKISGTINDDPQTGEKGDQTFQLSNVSVNSGALPGEIYVKTYSTLEVKRGDTVVLQGKLQEGFGTYPARVSYATLVSATAQPNPIREFRDRFAVGVRALISEPAASLGIGFVVGQRSALPPELDEKLRIVGLTHIVVASGYNLTILVRFARRLLENKSKYLAASVSGALTGGFVLVSGLSPSMTRAGLVTGLSLLAWYYGRRFHPLLLIGYVAALTAFINPIYIWSDLGWYLSFLAFSGILIVAPLISATFLNDSQPHPFIKVIIETSAAQIMTLPLILMIFGELPLLSLLSNALVASVIPLAMAMTALAGFTGMLIPAFSGWIGSIAELVISYVLAVVELLSSPSWAQIDVSLNPFVMLICYTVIAAIIITTWLKLDHDFRSSSVVE